MARTVHTVWHARRRARLAANLASGVGLGLALLLVLAAQPATPGAWQDFGFVTGAIGILLVGAAAPRLAVQAVWRLIRWRNHEEWG